METVVRYHGNQVTNARRATDKGRVVDPSGEHEREGPSGESREASLLFGNGAVRSSDCRFERSDCHADARHLGRLSRQVAPDPYKTRHRKPRCLDHLGQSLMCPLRMSNCSPLTRRILSFFDAVLLTSKIVNFLTKSSNQRENRSGYACHIHV